MSGCDSSIGCPGHGSVPHSPSLPKPLLPEQQSRRETRKEQRDRSAAIADAKWEVDKAIAKQLLRRAKTKITETQHRSPYTTQKRRARINKTRVLLAKVRVKTTKLFRSKSSSTPA
jgi:hypothetical protein